MHSLSQFLSWRLLFKTNKMAKSLRPALCHYCAHATHFRSCDVKQVISEKNAITHSLFNSRLQMNTTVILVIISNDIIHKNDTVHNKIG